MWRGVKLVGLLVLSSCDPVVCAPGEVEAVGLCFQCTGTATGFKECRIASDTGFSPVGGDDDDATFDDDDCDSNCCKICDESQACGDSCIANDLECSQPPGCACEEWEAC